MYFVLCLINVTIIIVCMYDQGFYYLCYLCLLEFNDFIISIIKFKKNYQLSYQNRYK